MRLWIRPLLVFLFVAVIPLPAWSIILETKEGRTIRGHLLRQDPLRVIIRVDGDRDETIFLRVNVKEIYQVVKVERLEELNPAKPSTYFDYALELAGQTEDPEARDMALRLFLISAYLEPHTYTYSALLRAANIARTPREARAFRALAYLQDLLHDPQILKSKDNPTPVNRQARVNFLKALELYRRGKTKEALEAASKDGVEDFFGVVPGLMSYAQFVQNCKLYPECTCKTGREFCFTCRGKGTLTCPDCKGKGWLVCKKCQGQPRRVPITPAQKQLLLQLQTLADTAPDQPLDSFRDENNKRWSLLLQQQRIEPIRVLSLICLTEFDPRQCVYRNGAWSVPEKK